MKANESKNVPSGEQVREAVAEMCREKGITKAEFAVKCGIDIMTLGALEHKKFDNVDKGDIIRIWNFCNRNNVAKLFNTTDFVATFHLCDKARRHRLMIGLTADTGMGKTTALSAYSRGRNVFYVSYDKTMNPRQFFSALLRELSYPFDGTLNDMINRASEELNRLENPLLIIDEAGKLGQSMILYLQVLRDKTKENCGIILSGMPYFKENLQRLSIREKEGYAEFLRRINLWHQFEGLQPCEIEEICQASGIEEPAKIKELKRKRRFGDLMNEIYLEKIMMEVM